jgi:UDP-N-acetyl-D-mannosaminuronic acid dehydrogenase
MPLHMASLIGRGLALHNRAVDGSVVVVLGYAYLENSDDARNSPSAALVEHLELLGAQVRVHDPHVAPYAAAGTDPLALADGADAVVLMVAHREYHALDPQGLRRCMRTPVLVDGRHVFSGEQATAAGLTFLSLGKGSAPGAA